MGPLSDLKENVDLKLGINIEENEVESLNQHVHLLDANYNVEGYERMKVKTISDHEVEVLIHASIVYMRDDFDESGGEHLIMLFLEHKNNHWAVVKRMNILYRNTKNG